MRKYLLLFVCMLASLYASADVTSSVSEDGKTLTLTVTNNWGAGGQIKTWLSDATNATAVANATTLVIGSGVVGTDDWTYINSASFTIPTLDVSGITAYGAITVNNSNLRAVKGANGYGVTIGDDCTNIVTVSTASSGTTTVQTKSVAAGSLSSVLTAFGVTSATTVVIDGTLNAADATTLSTIGATTFDLDGATMADGATLSFQNNTNVTSIILPSSTSAVDPTWFTGCTALKAAIAISTDGSALDAYVGVGPLGDVFTNQVKPRLKNSSTSAYDVTKKVTLRGTIDKTDFENLSAASTSGKNITGVESLDMSNATFNDFSDMVLTGFNATLKEVKFPTTKPAGVTAFIPDNCLKGNKLITSIDLPDNVYSYIGASAFAQMYTAANTEAGTPATGLKHIDIDHVTEIKANAFEQDHLLSDVKWSSSLTTIGENAFWLCTSLGDIILPEGLTTLSSGAFRQTNITSIYFPKTLKTIGSGAFYECWGLTTLTIPSSVETIEENAFQDDWYLRDVYCLASSATSVAKCAKDAFNVATYYDNRTAYDYYTTEKNADGTTYKTSQLAADQVFGTRETFWKQVQVDGKWTRGAAVLHFPDQSSDVFNTDADHSLYNAMASEYTDLTRKYTVADSAQYAAAVAAGTTVPTLTTGEMDGLTSTFTHYKTATMWPNVDQASNTYENEASVYKLHDGTDLTSAYAYTGWHQFILTAGVTMSTDPAKDPEIWPVDHMKTSTWYTMCFPFNMTKDQIVSAFGPRTEVCKFVGVDKVDNVLTLKFNEDLIVYQGDNDVSETNPVTAGSKVVCVANHPYLIHPSEEPNDGTQYKIVDIAIKKLGLAADNVTMLDPSEVDTCKVNVNGYKFVGSYKSNHAIPQYSYFLGTKNGVVKFFRETKLQQDGPGLTAGIWKPYTAVVLLPDGVEHAKEMNIEFGHFEDETTSIVDINADETTKANRCEVLNKVFNLNGQIVRTGTTSLDGLSKGIYIVNGKKYVVR